jgi:hypothetical protein
MKKCRVCEQERSLSEYHKRGSNTGNLRTECKQCIANIRRKHKFGMDHSAYKEMLESQDGRCAICAIHASDYSQRYKNLHVDHNHRTGKVRGLLCHNCNTALGSFFDDEEFLKSAVEYLQLHKQ